MNNLFEVFKNFSFKEIWLRFLADLRQAITAPTADPKVTLMVTLILMIIVTILVIIGIIIYTFTTSGRRVIFIAKVQLSEKDRLINNLLLVVFVLLLLFTSSYYAERQSSCLNCHKSSYQLAALKKTQHKNVRCLACHKEPGVSGYLRQKVDFVRMMFVFYTRRSKEVNPAVFARGGVFDGGCLRCHRQVLKETTSKNNLSMSHKEVVGTGFACVDCHNQVAHPGLTKPVKSYTMFACMNCHDGRRASKECRECHPKYSMGERVAKDVELPKTEIPTTLRCYGACHNEEKECLPCHGVTMPHPENWVGAKPAHVAYAAFTKKKLCWRCHYDGNKYFSPGREFCGRCHGIEFHGKDEEVYWSHQQFYAGNCEMLCHGPGFCSEYCHGPRVPKSPLPDKVKNSYFGYPPDIDF